MKICSMILFDLRFHFLARCGSEVPMDIERASLNSSRFAWLGVVKVRRKPRVKCSCTKLLKSPAMNILQNYYVQNCIDPKAVVRHPWPWAIEWFAGPYGVYVCLERDNEALSWCPPVCRGAMFKVDLAAYIYIEIDVDRWITFWVIILKFSWI